MTHVDPSIILSANLTAVKPLVESLVYVDYEAWCAVVWKLHTTMPVPVQSTPNVNLGLAKPRMDLKVSALLDPWAW
jgi:hypothetical protein